VGHKALKAVGFVVAVWLMLPPLTHLVAHLLRPTTGLPTDSFPLVAAVSTRGVKEVEYLPYNQLASFRSAHPDADFGVAGRTEGEIRTDPESQTRIRYVAEDRDGIRRVRVEYHDEDYNHIGEYEVRGGQIVPTYYRMEHAFHAILGLLLAGVLTIGIFKGAVRMRARLSRGAIAT